MINHKRLSEANWRWAIMDSSLLGMESKSLGINCSSLGMDFGSLDLD